MNGPKVTEKSFKKMSLLQIVEFLLNGGSDQGINVIREKFSSRFPEASIFLKSDRSKLVLSIEQGRGGCQLKFEKRGSGVVVKLVSNRTRELTFRDDSVSTRACIALEAILRGTHIDTMEFKRYNSGKISLHEISALPSMRNLNMLALHFDKLTNDEADLLLNGFPHAREEMHIKIVEEPQANCFRAGSIATRNLRIMGRSSLISMQLLLNSPISHIFMPQTKFHHLEIKLYLYAWQCGNNSNLKTWRSLTDDEFDVVQPVIGVCTISLERAKQIAGRFTWEDSVKFHGSGLDEIDGIDGFHLTRRDGKIASVFEYKVYRQRSQFLIFVWDDENPRRGPSRYQIMRDAGINVPSRNSFISF